MPKNVPPELEDKFKRCKEKVTASGQSEDAAYGICYTSVVEGKSLEDATKSFYLSDAFKSESLSGQVDRVRNAFMYQFEMQSNVLGYTYVEEVYPAYVIVCQHAPGTEEKYYKVNYSMTADGVVFQTRDQWQEVEEVYQAKSIKAGRSISAKNKSALRQAIDIINSLISDSIETDAQEAAAEEMKSETLVCYGGAVKSIAGKPGGYAVRFGGQDLTGDTFAKSTNFGFAGETTRKVDILFHHAQPIETKSGKRIQVLEPIGQATLKMSDDGVMIDEAILFNADLYAKHLDKLGWSTGAAAHSVIRDGGTIKQWQIAEVSLTPIPAEPRNMVAAKSLAGEIVDMDDEPDYREIGRQIGATFAEQIQQFRQSAK